jgi:DNA-binding response OmpR family regulator
MDLDGHGCDVDDVFMTAAQTPATMDIGHTREAADTSRHAIGTPTYLVLLVGHGVRPDAALQEDLARGGIRCLWFQSVAQALGAAAHAQFDAAVLHVGGALAAVAVRFGEWHQSLRCPIVVVTDQRDDVDEIIALELGADAYLPLPLPARRLSAHLQALVRRRAAVPAPAETPPAASQLQAGGWVLDRVRNRLTRGEQQVDLPDALASLLQMLMQDPGRVVSRSQLLLGLGKGRALNTRSVDRYVARLRQRLQDERVEGLRIDGVRGRGYSLSIGVANAAPSHLLRWLAPADPTGDLGLRGGVLAPG